jgi:hypothetical protein
MTGQGRDRTSQEAGTTSIWEPRAAMRAVALRAEIEDRFLVPAAWRRIISVSCTPSAFAAVREAANLAYS